MREAFDESVLPFAPGQSPFHVKGLVYRGHLDWTEAHAPGGVPAMRAAFKDPRLAPYFEQRFLPSSWYDLLPVVAGAYAVARLCGHSLADFLRIRTRHQAERDLGGVYKLLVKLASPAQIVSRYAAVQAQYFDFGVSSAKLVGPGHVLVERRQFPAILVDWMVPVQETYLDFAVRGAGAKRVVVKTPLPAADDPVHGLSSVRLVCEVTWM